MARRFLEAVRACASSMPPFARLASLAALVALALPMLATACSKGQRTTLAALAPSQMLILANDTGHVQVLLQHNQGCVDISGLRGTFDGKPVPKVGNQGGHGGGCAYVGYEVPWPEHKEGPIEVTIADGDTTVRAVANDLIAKAKMRIVSPASDALHSGDKVTVDVVPAALQAEAPQFVFSGLQTDNLPSGDGTLANGRALFSVAPKTPVGAPMPLGKGMLHLTGVFHVVVATCSGVPTCEARTLGPESVPVTLVAPTGK